MRPAVVFVLAHPDDEFFCQPLIVAEQAAGHPVHVLFLTDGGPQAAVRELESLAVLGGLGVSADRVRFVGREEAFRDGELYLRVKEARDWLAVWLGRLGDLERMYVPAYEGGHHDHDCCFGIVAALWASGRLGSARCLQFPLYNGRGLQGPLFRSMTVIPENGETAPVSFGLAEGAQYWRTWTRYPSQWRTWLALGPACAWAYLVRRTVEVQPVSAARRFSLPHPGAPYFQRRFRISANRVLEALSQL